MLQKLSLQAKLLIGVSLTCIVMAIISFGSWLSITVMRGDYDRITLISVPKLAALSDMRYYGSEVTRLFLRTTTNGLPNSEIERLKGKLEEHVGLYSKSESEYLALRFQEGEEPLYKSQGERWDETLVLIREGVSLIGNASPDAKARLEALNSTLVARAKVAHNQAFQKLQDFQAEQSRRWSGNAHDSAMRGLRSVFGLAIAGIFLSLVAGVVFARFLSRALSEIAKRMSQQASSVASSSDSIAGTSVRISEGATEQAASLEETAASMNEITAMVANSSGSVQLTREVASRSITVAAEGKSVMSLLLSSMREIESSNQVVMVEIKNSNEQIKGIVNTIESIREKTKVINEIVFQTKLLSFNASVEAARAGEQGKGFAVVAEEVGKLAQMSGLAAREISDLLTKSVDEVRLTVSGTQESVNSLIESGAMKIQNGVEIADRGNQMLIQIVKNFETMENHITEIANASDEQSKGIAEINTAITNLDNVTQTNSHSAESAAASAVELKHQANHLYELVAQLTSVIDGRKEGAQGMGNASNGSLS